VAGCFEHGTEPSCFIKCGEFVDLLSDYLPPPPTHTRTRLYSNNLFRCAVRYELYFSVLIRGIYSGRN